jgi:hypothetical protein
MRTLVLFMAFFLISCSIKVNLKETDKYKRSQQEYLINSWTARYDRPFQFAEWIVISPDYTFKMSDQRSGKIILNDSAQLTFSFDDEQSLLFRYFVDKSNFWISSRYVNETYTTGEIVIAPGE